MLKQSVNLRPLNFLSFVYVYFSPLTDYSELICANTKVSRSFVLISLNFSLCSASDEICLHANHSTFRVNAPIFLTDKNYWPSRDYHTTATDGTMYVSDETDTDEVKK